MADATQYVPTVAWRTLASNVYRLTKETVGEQATYRITVKAIDTNDIGHSQKEIGFYFADNIGTPYKIIAVDTNTIDVADDFRTGSAPTNGKVGIVYKSVGDGDAPYLAPIYYQFLHPMALENAKRYELDILWKNGGGGSPQVNGLGMSETVIGDMGLPSTIDSTTENILTDHSHTHKLGEIDISNVKQFGGYGALYNWYAATDSRKITSSDDWVVATQTQWEILLNNIDVFDIENQDWELAGGELKETGTSHWDSPNAGATNEHSFSLLAGGKRESVFGNIRSNSFLAIFDEFSETEQKYVVCSFNNPAVYIGKDNKIQGVSIRLLYTGVGTPTSYTQNDGTVIPVVQIGSQYWLSENLKETKFRNGDYIHGYDGGVYTPISNEDWAALTTGGMCYYNDNELLGTTGIPITDTLNSLQTQINNIPGDNTYLGLDDTSDTTYTGKDKYIPSVNEATGKLDLTETISATFLNLDDTPDSYSSQGGKIVKVNSGETALEFVSASGNETTTSIGALIGSAGDATPNDTDYVATALTSGGILKKITWTNVKAFLKTYFDGIYATITSVLGKKDKHGVESYSNLAWSDANHAVTLSAITYWYKGTKYTTSSTVTCDFDLTADRDNSANTLTTDKLYFVYFKDATGKLYWSDTAWDFRENVFVCTVFWNGTNGALQLECHNHTRDLDWHVWAHDTIGTRYESGLGIVNPTTTNDALLNINTGIIHDEDQDFTTGAISTMRGWYLNSVSTVTFRNFSLPYLGTSGQPQYLDTDTYTLTNVGATDYACYWVYAALDPTTPCYITPTHAATAFNTLQLARANTAPVTVGMNTEMKLIYKFIYKGDGNLQEITDYRTSSSVPSGGVTTLTADQISLSPSGSMTELNVQLGMDGLESRKLTQQQIEGII